MKSWDETGTRSRLLRAGTAAVAAALALSGSAAGAAFGSTHHSKHHSTSHSIKSLEKQLKTMEKNVSSSTPLQEAGSSLLYPLIAVWAQKFPYRSSIPVTAAAGGSGKGISGAIAGTLDIGGSDAYLPASDTSAMNIPLVISAQMINYNLPGLSTRKHLRLTPQVVNDIYAGKITNWDAGPIKKLNPHVKIPSKRIIVLHRSDGSGDTFLFSSFLASGDKSSFVNSQGGANTLINFPAIPGSLGENGNTGMLQTCAATPGCIAYIGVSYENSAVQASHLGIAALKNKSGRFVLPTAKTIAAEVSASKHTPASGTVSLINLPKAKKGYPIVNFEYAIVKKTQSSAKAAAIRSFLAWCMDPSGGATKHNLLFVHFQPLPANGLKVAVNLLKKL